MGDLYKEFSKDELLAVCNELDIDVNSRTTTRKLVAAAIEDMESNGVPDDDDISDVLWQFVDMAGLLDEEVEDTEIEEDDLTKTQIEIESGSVPDCFSWADRRDVACKRCAVVEACMSERVAVRESELPCFGRLYDRNDEQCNSCLEAGPCREITLN